MAVAAYASVLSILRTLDDLLLPSHRWIIPDMSQVETLQQNLGFLQEFLEFHSSSTTATTSKEALHDLAVKIHLRELLEATDDVLDIHIADRLRTAGSSEEQSVMSTFCHDLQALILNIESINQALTTTMGRGVATETSSARPPPPRNSSRVDSTNNMVGFEDHFFRIVNRLIGNEASLQVVPIVGMGGIGKTTLARNTFDSKLITEHFEVRIWISLSQEYDVHGVLLGLQRDGVLGDDKNGATDLVGLGTRLYQKLFGFRYLIVMDDVWSGDAWDDFKPFFPNNGNRSRVMVTTRLHNLAESLGARNNYSMSFLDEEHSWELFSAKAFSNGGRSSELEGIGKQVARNCRGLPLTLVVMGGLLAKSDLTREYWKSVADDMDSFYDSEIDESCLRTLSLSYDHLPIHLKPCFLTLEKFPAQASINVSLLIESWVDEGFVKPARDKTLEEVAMEYLEDLIGRSMILIRKLGSLGNVKECSVHDLMRQLCIKESRREYYEFSTPKGREIFISSPFSEDSCSECSASTEPKIHLCTSSQSAALTSRMVCRDCNELNELRFIWLTDKVCGRIVGVPLYVKCRWLSIKTHIDWETTTVVPPSPYLIFALWKLRVSFCGERHQSEETTALLSGMWEMPQLRRLLLRRHVLPPVAKDSIILEHLQKLATAKNLKLTEEVVRRIPNLKRLGVYYRHDGEEPEGSSSYCVNNLELLHKLRSLTLCFNGISLEAESIAFPSSLEKLTLVGCGLGWEDMNMIGSLPNLQVLKLYEGSFVGDEWCSVEGQFVRLKYLRIEKLDLATWKAEPSHFPALEKLALVCLSKLEECPLDIGDIDTLRDIYATYCSTSAAVSVINIMKEQVTNYGNEVLDIHIAHELLMEGDVSESVNPVTTAKIVRLQIEEVVPAFFS